MSEAGNPQEPSMEEILASIRKIISEDGEEEAVEGAAEGAVEETPLELVDEAGSDDAPLELTDEADMPDTGDAAPVDDREIAFEADRPESLGAEAPVPEPEPEHDAIAMPESGPERIAEPQSASENTPAVSERAPEAQPESASATAETGAAKPPVAYGEGIVSDPALKAGAAAFGELARTVRPEHSPGSGITVEQLAADLMRPMLREWLDENLPGMVERLVRREIERMARNGNDE